MLFISCSLSNVDEKYEIVEFKLLENKPCYCFLESDKKNQIFTFNRKFKILENNLEDTIRIGNSILSPDYVGNIYYDKYIDDNGNIHLVDKRYKNLPINEICVSKYKANDIGGSLKLEISLEE